jgi:recombination protein RecT
MSRVAITAYSKSTELQKCSAMSIVAGVIQASEMGLELTGPLGHAYLVPRWNSKTKSLEATFQIGYRGFIDLAHRSGRVKTFCAQVVYQNDTFDFQYGSDPKLHHKPTETTRGDVTHVYAVCLQTNGGVDFEVFTLQDIVDHVTQYCPDADKAWSPWKTAWKEMAKKTVIRRLAKRVPLSVEFARAADLDGQNETLPLGGDDNFNVTIDSDNFHPTNVDELKQKLTDQNGGTKQEQKTEANKDEKSVDDLVNETIGAGATTPKQKPTFNAEDGIR